MEKKTKRLIWVCIKWSIESSELQRLESWRAQDIQGCHMLKNYKDMAGLRMKYLHQRNTCSHGKKEWKCCQVTWRNFYKMKKVFNMIFFVRTNKNKQKTQIDEVFFWAKQSKTTKTGSEIPVFHRLAVTARCFFFFNTNCFSNHKGLRLLFIFFF